MSKRAGAIVTLDDLLDDIGVDAARWFLASRSHDTMLDLDLDLARSESQDNPVYYVQYAHARIASILRKAGDERVEQALAADLRASSEQLHPSARALVKRLLELPGEVREAARAAGAAPARRLRARDGAGLLGLLPRLPRGRRRRGGGRRGRADRDQRADEAGARAGARPARGRGAGAHVRLAAPRTVAVFLAVAAPAAAIDRYVPMKVPPGPGPAKYDKVFVQQLGPRNADSVLVLVPGTNGGAGGVVPVARDIVRRVKGLQVWIVDRREQAFEDTSVFRSGDPQRAQDYYLGFQYKRVARRGREVRRRLGAEAPAQGPAERDPARRGRRAAGAARRPFGWRLHRRGVRRVGLRRRRRLPRARRAGADRRRAARQLRVGGPGAREARARRHPHRQRLPRPARPRAARDQRDLRPGGRALGLRAARRAVRDPAVSRCCRPT